MHLLVSKSVVHALQLCGQTDVRIRTRTVSSAETKILTDAIIFTRRTSFTEHG